jgi:hypothetical protein
VGERISLSWLRIASSKRSNEPFVSAKGGEFLEELSIISGSQYVLCFMLSFQNLLA